MDIRVAFIGNVDSGKSSLIGTLMKGDLDDGRGSARTAIFRHSHEASTGRTSSIASAYMGFDEEGVPVRSKRTGKKVSWGELAEKSIRKIQLIDLAGHEKYLKTTVFGLTAMAPDFAIVVVGANMGVKLMTKEHLMIASALDIPVVVVVTKIDIAPTNVLKETVQHIRRLLKQLKRMPMVVKTLETSETVAKALSSNRITPIFPISNVTGTGLDNLQKFLSMVESRRLEALTSRPVPAVENPKNEMENAVAVSSSSVAETSVDCSGPVEISIDETYQIPGVGFVAAGTVVSGTINLNDTLMLGPDLNGTFVKCTVRSMECMHVPIQSAFAGQTAAFAIRAVSKKNPVSRDMFRKGMVLATNQL
jgi:small GTP-binding protein